MRVHLALIAITGLLLLAGIGTAAPVPDQSSSITSSPVWVVVAHQSTIFVTAKNESVAIPNAIVSVTLNSTALGSLDMPASKTTDGSGQASWTFTAGTIPGAVNITATITYNNYTITQVYTQNIDHDVASSAAYDYSIQATVATETPFKISYTDQWGNPIDNRNPNDPHNIFLTIGSTNNQAAFDINGTDSQSATLLLDSHGNMSVNVLTDTVAGTNIIYISHFGNVANTFKTIYGQTNALPFSITQVVSPDNPASQPADNQPTSKFTFTYTLYDKFGNVAENQSIRVQATDNSDTIVTTNEWGTAIINYGPRSMAGKVTFTATAVSNTSVSVVKEVQFYNTSPSSMVLSVNPQIMPSLDAKPGEVAQLVAKVTDMQGNPVAGETVYFSMGVPSYDYAPSVTGAPVLQNTSAITNEYGNAIVNFIPGSFETSKANVTTFDATDSGTVTVTASWTTIQQPITLSWKNYPYVKPNVTYSSTSANVGDTFDVTISLYGGGWNLTGHPADVVIVTDLAGGIGGPELLAQTKPAEKAFVNSATNDTYISLVSFGNAPATSGTKYASDDTISLWNLQKANKSLKLFNPYGSVWDYNYVNPSNWNYVLQGYNYCFTPTAGSGQDCTRAPTGHGVYWQNPYSDAKKEVGLLNAGPAYPANRNILTNKIDSYVSAGGTDYAAGINAAINELNANGNPTHNQTIIIMGDGINMMAPISPGSLESYWPSDWAPRSDLNWFDESEIGKAASVDAANRAKNQKMTIYAIGFSTLGYNDFTFFKPLASSSSTFYDESNDAGYKNLPGVFTDILGKVQNTAAVNATMNLNFQNIKVTYNNATTTESGADYLDYVYDSTASTKITDPYGNTSFINQTPEWVTNHTLTFNVGTITVGQTWTTTFRMRVLRPGNIEVIGNNSALLFNTGESENFGGGTISGQLNNGNTGISTPEIQVSNLQSQITTITDFVPLQWNITYTGNQTIYESIYYSTDNLNWMQASEKTIPAGNQTDTSSLDVRNLPSGIYHIKVLANAYDVQQPSSDSIVVQLGDPAKHYIQLE